MYTFRHNQPLSIAELLILELVAAYKHIDSIVSSVLISMCKVILFHIVGVTTHRVKPVLNIKQFILYHC